MTLIILAFLIVIFLIVYTDCIERILEFLFDREKK